SSVATSWPGCSRDASRRTWRPVSSNRRSSRPGSMPISSRSTPIAGRCFGLAYLHVMDGLAFGFHDLGEPMTLREFRAVFRGPLMGNCGYTGDTAESRLAAGEADLIAFGRPFISNPDLVERFTHDWPLEPEADQSDWYMPNGPAGYTDFSAYESATVA
ncbi:MAG: alkene reductase, partial [Planctomycetes bacterium]|nr:alkene reductase [Planctomycetota bacterium]